MLKVKHEDMQPTIQDAIESAKADQDFHLLPDDLVLQKDPGFDDEGYFIVVSKSIACQHYEDRFTVVGKVSFLLFIQDTEEVY